MSLWQCVTRNHGQCDGDKRRSYTRLLRMPPASPTLSCKNNREKELSTTRRHLETACATTGLKKGVSNNGPEQDKNISTLRTEGDKHDKLHCKKIIINRTKNSTAHISQFLLSISSPSPERLVTAMSSR